MTRLEKARETRSKPTSVTSVSSTTAFTGSCPTELSPQPTSSPVPITSAKNDTFTKISLKVRGDYASLGLGCKTYKYNKAKVWMKNITKALCRSSFESHVLSNYC